MNQLKGGQTGVAPQLNPAQNPNSCDIDGWLAWLAAISLRDDGAGRHASGRRTGWWSPPDMFDGLDAGVQALFIAPGDLVHWADAVRPHVVKMAEVVWWSLRGELILFTTLASGRMLLWIALEGADIACVMLTQIEQYPLRREMRCVGWLGHRPRRWLGLLAEVERAARETFRCDLMEALHQPAHARLLRRRVVGRSGMYCRRNGFDRASGELVRAAAGVWGCGAVWRVVARWQHDHHDHEHAVVW